MTGAERPVRRGRVLHGCAGVAAAPARTLTRNQIVIGQLVGATNYDIGHIALGTHRRRRRQPRRRRRQQQGAGLHRPADAGRRLLRRRLRGARDGPPVRRQPHVQRHAAQLLGRQPQRRHLGRARQRLVDHGLRRHLPAGQPAAAQRPVLVAAQLRRDHGVHVVGPRRRSTRSRPSRCATSTAPTRSRSPSTASDRADRRAARTTRSARHPARDPGRERGPDRRAHRLRRRATRSRSSTTAARPCRSSAARTTRPPGSRTRSRAATSSSRSC